MIDGSPWTFGRIQLIFERLKEGENPRTLAINKLDICVQFHDMETGFMSQRVVKDIGDYVGKFVESDTNNFVGVWREYLRVRVTISLDVPLKRRMKLRKNADTWCWVNFKYEGIPTFCFICRMVGHSDKFCAKLFDTPLDKIEKPYGSWMHADPPRRNHTIGSKWLRMGGGVFPASNMVAAHGNKSVTEIGANEIRKGDKSGITIVRDGFDNVGERRENQGAISALANINTSLLTNNQKNKIQNLFTSAEVENTEFLVADPKRRRMDQEIRSTERRNMKEDTLMSPQDEDNQNQKNSILMGAVMQARHSS